jgi:hypothetical protein
MLLLTFFAKAWQSAGRRLSLLASCGGNFLFLVVSILALGPSRADASVGVVLNESLNESMDRITGTGHTAVYFSNICADSPVKLRLCQPGELGSVMSTYINIGEDQPYKWNIIPLSVYLYGVEDPENRPIFGSAQVKHLLEERYRENYLSAYCQTKPCQTSEKAEWREMVAATMIRSVYIFAVDTTVEQDEAFIAQFNDLPNKNNFNGVTRNCADFTRNVINFYFPHAVYRDYLNDFGMESPKAVARTFTRYAARHPETNFRVMHFAQIPGTMQRSREVRSGTEQLYRSKLLIPMALFADHALPVVAASYLLTGRFNPEHTFEKYPAAGPDANPPASGLQRVATQEERIDLVGTSSEWKQYGKELDATVTANKDVIDKHDLARFFKDLDRAGTATIGENGSVWMEVWEEGELLKVGLSANNAVAGGSNAQLAHKFMLARTRSEVKSPKHSRETMAEFAQDWELLQRVSADSDSELAKITAPAGKNAPGYR